MRVKRIMTQLLTRMLAAIEYIFSFRLRHPRTKFSRPYLVGSFYSQAGQDIFLISILLPLIDSIEDVSNYIILDIGCNHPVNYSNSYFFERYFGFKTIAVDPLNEYKSIWISKRPRADFYSYALGKDDGVININVPISLMEADIPDDNQFDAKMLSFTGSANHKVEGLELESRSVIMKKASNILELYPGVSTLLCSIDVEGAELDILKGMALDKNKVLCFVVENNSRSYFGDEEIRLFLSEFGYKFYARIGGLDDVFIHESIEPFIRHV
jgi:FkbM family methyltransferase